MVALQVILWKYTLQRTERGKGSHEIIVQKDVAGRHD